MLKQYSIYLIGMLYTYSLTYGVLQFQEFLCHIGLYPHSCQCPYALPLLPNPVAIRKEKDENNCDITILVMAVIFFIMANSYLPRQHCTQRTKFVQNNPVRDFR